MENKNIIVHVHIFKNAGSSFDDTLLTNFNGAFIDHREDHLIRNDKNFLENYLIKNSNVNAFSSHSVFHKPEDFNNVKLHSVYFLRHPIERIKSAYSFEVKQPAKDSLGAKMAKELNLQEYVRWRMQDDVPATIRNLQTIFLAGDGPHPSEMKKKFELALKNLNSSHLIGVVDRYDESMVVFEEYLKQFFPKIDLSYIRRNITDTNINASVEDKVEKLLQQFDEPLQTLVKKKNEYDIALYKKANTLLDEKIEKIDDFEKKLRDFKERCQLKPIPSLPKEKINKIEKKVKMLSSPYIKIFKEYKELGTIFSQKLVYKISPFNIQKRKKVLIQANCQGAAIKNIFQRVSRLNENYEIISIKPVHLWKEEDKEDIFRKIAECDIFLHQPIAEENFGIYASENIKKYLKSDAISVSFPNLYFTGYHPQAFYMKDDEGKKVSEPFDYHDRNIFNFFSKVFPKEAILNKITDESFYSTDEIKSNINKSLLDLKKREENTSIKVSTFIEENMIGKKLFHIFNHPTNEMLFYLFDKILENLNEPILANKEKILFKKELLGAIQYPIYPSVQNYFSIEEPLSLENRGKVYTLNEIINMYLDYYSDQTIQKLDIVRNIIVHVHIFKNAGSSFDDTLLTNFNGDFIDHREDHLIREDKDYLENYLTDNDNVKAFSSHSIYHKPKDFNNTKLHTLYFLRHPIERIKSVYSFEKKQPAEDSNGAKMAKELNLQEYVRCRMQDDVPATIRNLQTIFLAGDGPHPNDMEKKFELALTNLNSSPLIGVVDRYDESMVVFEEYFKQLFPKIDLSYIRRNVTDTNINASVEEKAKKLLQQFDEPLQKLLKEKNTYDFKLYKKANILLDEKIGKIDDFEKKLHDFKERCRLKLFQSLFSNDKYEEVVKLSEALLDEIKKNIRIYLLYGESLQKLKSYIKAIAVYENIILEYPGNPWAYFYKAEIYLLRGDKEKAKALFDSTCEKFKNNKNIITIFTTRFMNITHPEDTLSLLNYLKTKEDDPSKKIVQILIDQNNSNDDHTEASQLINQFLDINQSQPDLVAISTVIRLIYKQHKEFENMISKIILLQENISIPNLKPLSNNHTVQHISMLSTSIGAGTPHLKVIYAHVACLMTQSSVEKISVILTGEMEWFSWLKANHIQLINNYQSDFLNYLLKTNIEIDVINKIQKKVEFVIAPRSKEIHTYLGDVICRYEGVSDFMTTYIYGKNILKNRPIVTILYNSAVTHGKNTDITLLRHKKVSEHQSYFHLPRNANKSLLKELKLQNTKEDISSDLKLVTAYSAHRINAGISNITDDEWKFLSVFFTNHPNISWHLIGSNDPIEARKKLPLTFEKKHGHQVLIHSFEKLENFYNSNSIFITLPNIIGGGGAAYQAIISGMLVFAERNTRSDISNQLPSSFLFNNFKDIFKTIETCIQNVSERKKMKEQLILHLYELNNYQKKGKELYDILEHVYKNKDYES